MSTPRITRTRTLAVSVMVVAALSGTVLVACSPSTSRAAAEMTQLSAHHGADRSNGRVDRVAARTRLYTTMRSLWEQHMEWTWSAVVAFATDSPALPATFDRLLRNQADIGSAVAAVYGPAAGDRLTALLKTHINDAVPVLQAAKAGDKPALDEALTAWYANAREIADFLSAANPRNWGRDDMRDMMKTHIDQTTAYAASVIGGDYTKAIATYDVAQAHMVQMADMLSAGIVAQFPRKF